MQKSTVAKMLQQETGATAELGSTEITSTADRKIVLSSKGKLIKIMFVFLFPPNVSIGKKPVILMDYPKQ